MNEWIKAVSVNHEIFCGGVCTHAACLPPVLSGPNILAAGTNGKERKGTKRRQSKGEPGLETAARTCRDDMTAVPAASASLMAVHKWEHLGPKAITAWGNTPALPVHERVHACYIAQLSNMLSLCRRHAIVLPTGMQGCKSSQQDIPPCSS
eukprot:1152526-Pelagomonas_calceolata.AAC.9